MDHELNSSNQLNDQVGDALSTTATPTMKKENVLERINKRNKERQNYLDVKLEQRNKENLQLEGEDYFSQSFAHRAHEIEARIQNIQETSAKKAKGDATTSINITDLTRLFAELTVEIQELQRYLTTSTMFLTDFKVKTCQNILNDLTTNLDETRTKLMPKKKFGFSGKKSAAKSSNVVDKLDAPVKEKLSSTLQKAFDWTISNRKGEYICLRENEVNGQDITISQIEKCFIELQGHPGSVQVSHATDCTLLCGPIARSLFAENCQNVDLAAACQQLRLHTSNDLRIYLHVTCRAIIEDCKKIAITDYNYDYPELDTDYQKSNLDREQNNYKDVADFNWLSPDAPSPNWQLMTAETVKPNWHEMRKKFQESLTHTDDNREL